MDVAQQQRRFAAGGVGRWIVALWLAVAMIAMASSAQADEAIEVWHAYTGAEQTALRAAASQWNELHPDRPVRLLGIPYEAFANRLTSAIPRGHGPDVFIAAHERAADWDRSGFLATLDERVDREEYFPTTVDALTVNGRLLGVPLAFKSIVLFYNADLLERPPQTTQELLEMAHSFTDRDQGRYGLAYQATDFYFHAPWFFGYGAEIFDDDGEIALDSEEGARSLEFAHRLMNVERVVPPEPTGALVAEMFRNGEAAMAISGSWFLGQIGDDVNFEMAPLPAVSETGKAATPFLTVEAAFVSAHSERKDDAAAFAAFLAEEKVARDRALTGMQPVATKAAWEHPELGEHRVLSEFRAQKESSIPMPVDPRMRSVWEPAQQALGQVLREVVTAEVALAQAENRFEIYTRPPPDPADPKPLLVGLILLVMAGLVWGGWRFRRDRIWAKMKASKPAYVYMAPAIVGMLVLLVVPFVVGAAVSLFSHVDGEFTYVGLANFLDIVLSRDYGITDPHSFYFTLAVTVGWTVLNVTLHVSIGVAMALLLRDPWMRLRGVYRVLLIIPWAIPNYITALIWRGMFHHQFGAVNRLLSFFGVDPISWFSQFATAFAANLVTNTWLGFPFMMVVTLGALQAIPRELEEAAEVDGAGRWQRFRHVTWPLLKPALIPAVVLGTVWTFNMFNIIYLVSEGAPDGGTEILISEAYKWAFTRQEQYGYAAAYAVLIFFVLLGYGLFSGQLKAKDPAGEED